MRQFGKRIEALSLTAQHLGEQLARQMGTGDAMAAVALHVVDVGADTAKLRQARQGEQEVAGPGVLHLDVRQLREGFQHLGMISRSISAGSRAP